MSLSKRAWTAYGLAGAVLVLDQTSKYWILNILDLPSRGSVPVFWPLNLTMVWNQGVSFGLLQAQHDLVRWALVVFSLAVATILVTWARKAERLWTAVALGLVIGGAVGNAIDRARFGAVADFIDVQAIGFFPWVFNVADSGITVGVILLLLDGLRRDRPA